MTQIEVRMIYSKWIFLKDDSKKVEVEQKMTFSTWDDFQNWLGYTVEALSGSPLKLEVKMVKEEASNE